MYPKNPKKPTKPNEPNQPNEPDGPNNPNNQKTPKPINVKSEAPHRACGAKRPEKGPSCDGPFRAAGALTTAEVLGARPFSRFGRRRDAVSPVNANPQTYAQTPNTSFGIRARFWTYSPSQGPDFSDPGARCLENGTFGAKSPRRAPIYWRKMAKRGRKMRCFKVTFPPSIPVLNITFLHVILTSLVGG